MLSSTIREIIVRAEQTYGDADAIRYKKTRKEIEAKSYTDLRQDSESFSNALAVLGEDGCHVALTGATSYGWISAYFGIVNSAKVAVPLDVSLPLEEMLELIDRSDATIFIADAVRLDVLAVVKERCKKVKYVISLSEQEHTKDVFSYWELLKEYKGSYDFCPKPDELATIMFTSGTTGKSKGVMLTHRNLAENATCLDMKFPKRSVLLSVLPIHHAYCLAMDILKGLSCGSIICINDSLIRMVKNIKLFEPTIILMVPLMIETVAKKLEDAANLPPEVVKEKVFGSQLQFICSGGAYMPPAMVDLFAKYDIAILQGYGMTECAPVISTTVSWNIKKGTVGQLIPNCEAKVVDEELWVRGSSVMQGYYKMPKETSETLVDGWLRTGDLGYVDEEGFVYLTGRKKNLIITKNGENVSPEEIENKIGEHRLVQEILVRENEGLIEAEIFPDFEYAQKIGVKDVEHMQTTLQEMIDRYNENTPAYKKVYRLKVREIEFEKTPSKKIKRY